MSATPPRDYSRSVTAFAASGVRENIRARLIVGAMTLVGAAAACTSTDSRLIVAPDGTRALYVECTGGPLDCLEIISEHCRGGYEVLAQGTRGEVLMGDKLTQAATDAAAAKLAGAGAKGIQATPTDVREMIVRCGRTASAPSDFKGLLSSPFAASSPVTTAAESSSAMGHRAPPACKGASREVQTQRAAQWRNILAVRTARASQPGVSAELACNMARRLFVEQCPEWDDDAKDVERAVCHIADAEALARQTRAAVSPLPERIELEETE